MVFEKSWHQSTAKHGGKMSKRVNAFFGIVLTASMFLVGGVAFADHNHGQEGYSRVINEVSNLNNLVQSSWLQSGIKQTVSRFHASVHQLDMCGGNQFQFNPAFELIAPMDHGGDSGGYDCQNLINRLRWQWREVDRYLYDTNYDFPNVHQAYHETKDALVDAGIL